MSKQKKCVVAFLLIQKISFQSTFVKKCDIHPLFINVLYKKKRVLIQVEKVTYQNIGMMSDMILSKVV